MKLSKKLFLSSLLTFLLLALSACSSAAPAKPHGIRVVTTTNIYANIAQNVLGKYGRATAIIQNGTTDPHDFEPTTNNAKLVAKADIVVANGMGYDSWMNNLADSNDKKTLMVGEDLMGLKKGDNPHIWYNLRMPQKYVAYLVARFSKLQPRHAAYFKKRARLYLAKVNQIRMAARKIKGQNHKMVFVSEPVFDYALQEAGYRVGDREFEEAIENGTDPSPQMVNAMTRAINHRRIAFFVNNTQSSSSTVNNFIKLARSRHIPVISVRETIPNRTTYLSWMKSNYQKLINVSK